MEDYERQRIAALLSLRAFPRSIGMLTAAITIAVTREPITALGNGLTVWLVAWILKSLAGPRLVDINLWQWGLSTCVLAVGAWIIKWPVFIGLVLYAIFTGAPSSLTLWSMGALLALDVFTVLTKGS